MPQAARILIIDDDPEIREACGKVLAREGFHVFSGETGARALELLRKEAFDLVLLDLCLPDMSGTDILKSVRDEGSEIPVIMITGYATVESAVKAMKAGASDYLSKPFSPDELRVIVHKALENHKLLIENIYLKGELDARTDQGLVAGRSRAFSEVLRMIEIAAPTDSTVLVTGESGTGKEVVAREIHHRSGRAGKPFVAVDCSTLVDSLFESELFGHLRGSFTGAVATKTGRLELADKGTIFFDEISNLSMNLQAKLLRVIQEREITKVGDTKVAKIDVRIIAATNNDLSECVVRNVFREDLFYRLNVIPIRLPPLRERKEDIPLFAEYFVRRFGRKIRKTVSGISPEALKLLSGYEWPGNVRELENLIERAVVLAKSEIIGGGELVFCGIGSSSRKPGDLAGETLPLREFEEEYVKRVVAACDGNISKASKVLQIDRKTIRTKLQEKG